MFEDFINFKELSSRNKYLQDIISKYSFILLDKEEDIDKNILTKFINSQILIFNIQEKTDDGYLYLSFEESVIIVDRSKIFLLINLLQKKLDLKMCFLFEKAKDFFDTCINQIKYMLYKCHEGFDRNISIFLNLFQIKKSKSKILFPLAHSICGYLLEKSYLKLKIQRIKGNINNDNYVLDIIDDAEYIDFDTYGFGSYSNVHLIYLISKNELFMKKVFRENSIQYLEKEIHNYSKLKHPLLCKLIGKTKKPNEIIIEYIYGPTLRNCSFDDENTKFKIIFELILVIKYIHDQNFIYADLKPDNLIYDDINKSLILIDLDHMINNNDPNENITISSYSKNYSAPESDEGKVSNKSDIYSLGQVIYFIMHKKDPSPNMQMNESDFKNYPIMKRIYQMCSNENEDERPSIDELMIYFAYNFETPFENIIDDIMKDFDDGIDYKKYIEDFISRNKSLLDSIRMKYGTKLYSCSDDQDESMLYQLGLMFYKGIIVEKDIQKAIHYFTLAADKNNPNALFYLGLIYISGHFISPCFDKSLQYFSLAAKQNHILSIFVLGSIYINQMEINKGLKYYILAAELNCSEAQFNLGDLYIQGKFVTKDIDKAIHYFTLAANQNHSMAQYNLGIIYESNEYNTKNVDKSIYYYTLAANQNHPDAQFALGLYYENNQNCNSSIDKAIYYYNLAASNNHTESQFRLGYIYQTNNNISKSIHYYILAASNKHPKSLYNLGLIYLNRDIHQSLFYFELAARQNYPEAKLFFAKIHLLYQFKISDFNLIIQYLIDASNASIAEAQFFLGFIYESDKFVKQDIEKAIKYYKMTAAKYSQARINLGRIFYEGKYVKRNIKEAIKYFDLAKKEDNNYDAMNYLGIIFKNGIDVPKDIQLAKNNFELAAKEKYAPSLYNLGNIFLNEDIVDKAIEYYEQASNQGYLLAYFQLGMIYIDKIYKKYDIEKAIHYFSIAADQNEPNSQFQLGIIYLTNVHIKPNFEKAFYYIRRSAWNNNSMSQYFLGIAYMNGNHGVKQNYREARNYLFRSASKRCGNSLFAYGFLCHEGKVIHQDIEMAIRFIKMLLIIIYLMPKIILVLYTKMDLVIKLPKIFI